MSLFTVTNLEYNIPNRKTFNVSFKLEQGEVLRICGPSGYGKTTLLRILTKLGPSLSGSLLIQGNTFKKIGPQKWRSQIGYVQQSPVMFEGTVLDNLKDFFSYKSASNLKFSREKVLNMAKQFRLPSDILNQNAKTLSGGEAMRIALIRMLILEPYVLLLDEITAPLDEKSSVAVINYISKWIKKPKRAVIFVAHNISYWNAINYKEFNFENMNC